MTFPCHKRRKVELSLQRISFVSLCVSCPLHDMCFATSSLFFETVKAVKKKNVLSFPETLFLEISSLTPSI